MMSFSVNPGADLHGRRRKTKNQGSLPCLLGCRSPLERVTACLTCRTLALFDLLKKESHISFPTSTLTLCLFLSWASSSLQLERIVFNSTSFLCPKNHLRPLLVIHLNFFFFYSIQLCSVLKSQCLCLDSSKHTTNLW